MQAGAEVERVQIIRLFGRYDCLIEPALVDHLAKEEAPEEKAEAVLKAMGEVPFYLTLSAFLETEASLEDREEAEATPEAAPADDPLDEEHAAARKAALAKMLSLVYDQKARGEVDLDAEDDAADDHDDELVVGGKKALKEYEVDWSKPVVMKPRGTWRPVAADHDSDVKVLQDITGQSTCEGSTDDFHKYFSSRFHQMEKILRRRRELANAQPIEKAMEGTMREVSMIGMVTEQRTTANGHKLIQIEDETGVQPCLVVNNERSDPQLVMSAGVLVPDEVIGIVGQKASKGDLVIVEQIVRPDIPFNAERVQSEEPLAAAFFSDVHVGSDLFLEKNFLQAIKWLNGVTGNAREREMAGRIKYVVLPGDMVDGVGIYPGQEHGLKFTDIYDQYAEFGRLLQYLPDHVEVLVQPGNHDAARPNEPQPALDKEAQSKFDGVNATFLGNPSLFSLNGVRVLSYHGVSLMDFATTVTGLEHHDPVPIMEEILKCRHLAPIYGLSTPLAPEHRDWMVIEQVPELFVTGHVHTYNTRNYRGVNLCNASTWQAQTDYQKMLNFKPDPCRMPIFDLKNLKTTAMDFGMGMDFAYKGG